MPTRPVALVTGATSGIGRATALALGEAGYAVGVCARGSSAVKALVAELSAAGIPAAGQACDVSEPAQVAALHEHVASALGPVSALVNNAGVLIAKRFEELSLADWDGTMAVNLRSLFLLTREVLPAMRQARAGTIVNVASLAGRNGFVGGTAYAASKHAVLGFSRSLLLEVRKDGVRVVAICPGSVATPMLEGQPLLPSNPQRILQPGDVAATIVGAITLPARALISELDIRPSDP